MHFNRLPAGVIRFLAALACAAAVLLPCGHAAAQGTSGMLPDPISTRDLDDYARMLQLSQQQRQAIDPMHDQYLEQFNALRDSDISKFLESAQSLRRNMFDPSGTEEVKKATRDHKRIMARIATLDEQLLNQVQTVLSEQQLAALSRVRMARERERYTSDATRFATASNPGVRVDLSEIVDSLELGAEERQLIDPQIITYEQQLTAALRQLHASASGMFERISATVAEAGGMPAEGERDPEQMRKMFQTFREAWETEQAAVMDEALKVSDLNRSTYKAIAPQLNSDNRRDFQRRYERRAYSSAFRGTGGGDRRLNAALALEELPEDVRASIEQLRMSFETQRNPMADQLMNLTDEQRAARGGGFRFGGDDEGPMREQLDAQRDRLRGLEDDTIAQLNAILGDELVASLDGRGGEDAEAGAAGEATFTAVTVGAGGGPGLVAFSGTVELEEQSEPSDPFLPGPISRSDLEYYLSRLNVDEQRRAIVDSIYTQYMNNFQQVREQYIEPLADATRDAFSFRRTNDQDERAAPSDAEITQMFTLRREGLNTVLALDRTFFEDLGLLLESGDAAAAQFKRCEQSRLRDVYNRGETGNVFMGRGPGGGRFRGDFGGGQEERVDLTRATRDIAFGESSAQVDSILSEYSDAITDAFRRQYESSLEFAEATARVMVDAFQATDDDEGRQRSFRVMGERMRDLNETYGVQRREAGQAVVALNRQTVDRMREMLPEMLSRSVRDAYYQAAFPSVYSDRRSAERQIEAAMQLPSLTGPQRAELTDVAAEFRGAYDELCLKMVEAQMAPLGSTSQESRDRGRAAGGPGAGPGNPDWQRMQEQRNEMERLRFSRNELNEKARLRMRGVLNEQQVTQVPGLSDEEDDD